MNSLANSAGFEKPAEFNGDYTFFLIIPPFWMAG